jgi:hypothetical protein
MPRTGKLTRVVVWSYAANAYVPYSQHRGQKFHALSADANNVPDGKWAYWHEGHSDWTVIQWPDDPDRRRESYGWFSLTMCRRLTANGDMQKIMDDKAAERSAAQPAPAGGAR